MQAFLTSIGAHPQLALAVILLTAFLESLAFIGTAIPAAIVMFTGGALIGAGLLDLWPTLGAALLGAVAGDGLSYELGRHQAARIRNARLLARYAGALARGERFVHEHGGKSILLARFVAPMRAVVPIMAGVAAMPRVRFYLANILSAALWAPAHILPGLVFGASLRVAEAVTARLGLLLLLVAALLWLSMRLARAATGLLLPLLRQARARLVAWAAASRPHAIARLVLFFLDPRKPQSELLLMLALLLLGSGWLFLGILEDVLTHDKLVQVDVAVFHFLNGLRTSIADRVMLALAGLGSVAVLLPLSVLVAAWLALRRCWRTLVYWLAALLFSQLLVALLKVALARPSPFPGDAAQGFEQFSFPSGHSAAGAVIYGFLAFLLARRQPLSARATAYGTAAAVVTLIGLAHLYLGTHWLSDVLGGICLGLAWVALLAMLYTHYGIDENLHRAQLGALAAALLLLYAPWRIGVQMPDQLARYAPHTPLARLSAADWQSGGWRQLPRRRTETGGSSEECFSLQWADSAAGIARQLQEAGWTAAPDWSLHTALRWLLPGTPLIALPVLPKFDRGRESRLAFIHRSPEHDERVTLRLWRSDFVLPAPVAPHAVPLWYGALYREEFKHPLRLLTLYRTRASVAPARMPLAAAGNTDQIRQLRKTGAPERDCASVWLVAPSPLR